MKKLLLLAAFVSTQCVAAQHDPKNAVEMFFEAFHARDTVKLKAVMAKDIVLHSVGERAAGTKFSVESAGEFLKSIAGIPDAMKFEERIVSFNVQTDGSMAHVWTPYEFYINGKQSHSGVNSFQLVKENELWKVVYLIDTRRK